MFRGKGSANAPNKTQSRRLKSVAKTTSAQNWDRQRQTEQQNTNGESNAKEGGNPHTDEHRKETRRRTSQKEMAEATNNKRTRQTPDRQVGEGLTYPSQGGAAKRYSTGTGKTTVLVQTTIPGILKSGGGQIGGTNDGKTKDKEDR